MESASIRFHAGATEDYEAAISGYARESETAAIRFVDTVEAAISDIVESPQRFPRVSPRHRRAVIGPFPFSIVFTETDVEIVIIAVAHARRRPGYWRRRKP